MSQPDIDDMAMQAEMAKWLDDPEDHELPEGVAAYRTLYVDRTEYTEIKSDMVRLFGPYETQEALKRAAQIVRMIAPRKT